MAFLFSIDMFRPAYRLALIPTAGLLLLAAACGGDEGLILATTTSTFDSGLLDELEPLFEEQTGLNLKIIAVGTGQALEMGRRGDADVLLVHAPTSEEEFMAGGYGVNRQLVMHNDFLIVGPADDPADLRQADNAATALHGILKSEQTFVSRGDDSGTHKRELAFWEELEVDPTGEGWYLESGLGMGAARSGDPLRGRLRPAQYLSRNAGEPRHVGRHQRQWGRGIRRLPGRRRNTGHH
jgi:tungstate transport system substrate-binding protein